MTPSNRREFLQGLLGAAILGTGCSKHLEGSTRSTVSSSLVADALRSHAQARGLFYGAAATHQQVMKDQAFSDTLVEQCGMLVPETELKWQALRPAADKFNFEGADWMVNFAQQHK